MLSLSRRSQILIGTLLAVLMIATRSHHFASMTHLPGASWAVFFLAGVYLASRLSLPGFLALTWFLDYAAYAWGGASNFCITPAYVFLLPAYTALWLAGRWYRQHHQFAWSTLLPLVGTAFIGAAACELFSSGGFYFFSGRFAEPTLVEFGQRLMQYFPAYLQSMTFYVGIAAFAHASLGTLQQSARTRTAAE